MGCGCKGREIRKEADLDLFERALEVRRDGSSSKYLRFKAFCVEQAFRVRIKLGWHSYPSGWLTFRFHGFYCGPGQNGHGHVKPPIDRLDCACADHDMKYNKSVKFDD